MGWRGALRAIAAAERAAARERVRVQRLNERLAVERAKLDALNLAALEVQEFEDRLTRLTSVHRECSDAWDWESHALAAPPVHPKPSVRQTSAAQHRLDHYTPSWVDKLLRRVDRRRAELAKGLSAARTADDLETTRLEQEFTERHAEWAELRDLASRILSGDPLAFRDAADELSPLREIGELGSRIELSFRRGGVSKVKLHVNSESVIPTEVKSLLQSGKLSIKRMPSVRFHELYQDYVSGATLRIARELMALLPVHTVHVTAVAKMLNSASGHQEDTVILSVMMPRDTLMTLNFSALDASDALRNFRHTMDFKKSRGFAAVAPLLIEPVPTDQAGWSD
jgi:hypothetical protein